MPSVEQTHDSVRNIARYFGYRQNRLAVKGFLDDFIGALEEETRRLLKEIIRQMLGEDALSKIKQLDGWFTDKNGPVWAAYQAEIRVAAAKEAGEKTEDVRVYFDEFNAHHVSSLDTFKLPPSLESDLVNGKPLNLEGLEITLIQIQGDFKFGVEGVVPWPMPDPDLVFEWEVEISLIESDVWLTFILCFKGVEGPGIGWLLAAIAYFYSGGAIGFGLWAGAAGYELGEGLDLVYETAGDKPEILRKLESVFDGAEVALTRGVPEFKVFRPNRQRSFGLSMKVQHAVSAIEGLLEKLK